MNEQDRIITLNGDFLPAIHYYEAVRYLPKAFIAMEAGLDTLNPLEKFALQVILKARNLAGSGTANALPPDVFAMLANFQPSRT